MMKVIFWYPLATSPGKNSNTRINEPAARSTAVRRTDFKQMIVQLPGSPRDTGRLKIYKNHDTLK